MKSVMTNEYKAPSVQVPRSRFDRSKGRKHTFNADYLYPIYWDEVLPGDTVNLSTSMFTRLSTPIYPIMDNQKLDIHWFYVPLRLVWNNAEQFFGEDLVGGDGNAPTKPMRTANTLAGVNEGGLEDAMGLTQGVPDLRYDELPLRAYYLIWNEWFRAEYLQEKFPVDFGDEVNDWSTAPAWLITEAQGLLKRAKRHDYFTSCLPWPQRGPDITLPVVNPFTPPGNFEPGMFQDEDGQGTILFSGGTGNVTTPSVESKTLYPLASGWNENAGTINQLRFAFAVQKYYEKDARGGSRYPEILRSHFGVVSPDARLQRPELLGKNSATINVTPVAQTFETDDSQRTVGDLGAMGTSSMQGQRAFVKSFTEHGFIIGMMSVTADLTYQQAHPRKWTRETRFEYYWPSFAGLGEQSVWTYEIYAGSTAGGATSPLKVLGFQARYEEYRRSESEITGAFYSNNAGTLDAWHLSQYFDEEPVLNSTFIESDTPMERVLAVTDEPQFIGDFYFHQTWVRPIPMYGVPGNTDRF